MINIYELSFNSVKPYIKSKYFGTLRETLDTIGEMSFCGKINFAETLKLVELAEKVFAAEQENPYIAVWESIK
jgi:hypothetical protein